MIPSSFFLLPSSLFLLVLPSPCRYFVLVVIIVAVNVVLLYIVDHILIEFNCPFIARGCDCVARRLTGFGFLAFLGFCFFCF